MIGLYLSFFVMLTLAIALLVVFYRYSSVVEIDRSEFNKRIYQQRKGELNSDQTLMPAEEKAYLITELKQSLLNEVMSEELLKKDTMDHKPKDVILSKLTSFNFLAVCVCFLLFIISLTFYFSRETRSDVSQWLTAVDRYEAQIQKDLTEDEVYLPNGANPMDYARVMQWILQRESSAKGWQRLSKIYFELKASKAGFTAAQKAYYLAPDDLEIQLSYVRATLLNNKGKPSEESNALLDKLRIAHPGEFRVLIMQGLSAFAQREYMKAEELFEAVLVMKGGDDSNLAYVKDTLTVIRTAIAKEEGRTYSEASPEINAKGQQGSLQASASTNSVTVLVGLSADVKASVSPEARVFIYAKPVTGMRAPLAAVTVQVKDLPITVRLSDQDAMISTHKISQHEKIMLGARVSIQGQAIAQDGDYVAAELTVTQPAAEDVFELVISKQYKAQ